MRAALSPELVASRARFRVREKFRKSCVAISKGASLRSALCRMSTRPMFVFDTCTVKAGKNTRKPGNVKNTGAEWAISCLPDRHLKALRARRAR